MNDSYRATLILVGLTVMLSGASWRMLQLDGAGRTVSPAPRPSPHSDTGNARAKPAPRPHVPTMGERVGQLIDAAQRGDAAAILAIAAKGVNINSAGEDGLTPLLAAIHGGKSTPALIAALIHAGADATARDRQGRDALTMAVDRDDVDAIAALLKSSPSLAGHAGDALRFAAAENHLESLKTLVDNGVDVNAADSKGRTALAAAIEKGEPDTIQFLIDHNADPNLKNPEGLTALMLAARRGQVDLVKALAEKSSNVNERGGQGETALLVAVRAHNAEAAKTLLEAGADVNLDDADHATPLMAAASSGDTDLVRLLLDKGADAAAHNADGETALSLARKNDHGDTADVLAAVDTERIEP
jgi:ankyrin repeat protein